MLYEISDQQIQNIKIFLKRITLSTDEALPYLQILQVLNTPVVETKKDINKISKIKKVDKVDNL